MLAGNCFLKKILPCNFNSQAGFILPTNTVCVQCTCGPTYLPTYLPNGKDKGKGKIVPVVFLTEDYTMEVYLSGGIAPCTLISTLDRGGWSASHPGCFTPREIAPGTHWIGGWVGPRASLDTVVKRKIPSS
jgi:hypothetical protein